MTEGLKHYGTPRHSGRYPWGSGEDPQRSRSFLQEVDDLKKKGLTEKKIAEGMKMTTSQLRARKSILRSEQRNADAAQALKLKDKGYSNVEIGKKMGKNESSVRALLDPSIRERTEITSVTANMLKDTISKKGYIDVGVGVEKHMGVSRVKLKTAIEKLKEEGYLITYVPVEQLGTGKKTTVMVMSKPKKQKAIDVVKLKNQGKSETEIAKEMGISEDDVKSLLKETFSDVYRNKDNIRMITDYSEDGGRSFLGLEPIRSVSSDRISIKYYEDGGSDKDGVIEIRPGVEDISLGNSKYAQVRIGVDGTHYLKGMAMYNDDLPKGIDIVYNTNKGKGTPKEKVFKEMKKGEDGLIDPDNPFGATVRQKHYIDANGKKQLSALNIVNEEGEWQEKWSKSLSSQMLSKQSPSLAKKQLGLTYDIKKDEFDQIMSLTNPTVKKKLLDSFADDCDSSAVHLKAAALPREGWHVILPFPNMKEDEVYAPNYNNGEQVVLIRYPHGGIFEIPQLTVNNRNQKARSVLNGAKDAIGIHPKVAERLSGADFDGDTVLVIPNTKGLIKTSSPLKGLENFDPKISYKPYHGMKTIDGGIYNAETGKVDYGGKKPVTKTKQMKMGDISNLITDMTIMGAKNDEIARAVRHSMVVIDAEKHHLDYARSYIENGIPQLKKKYQGKENSGAATLISRASSPKRVDIRKVKSDPLTGQKLYTYKKETYINKNGKETSRTTSSTKMAETDDAFTLSSGTPMELIYANHANKLKALANQARKVSLNTEPIPYSPSARKAYAPEVAKLNADLNIALKNAPLERQAQLLANSIVAAKKAANPYMDPDDLKKIKGQALAEARVRTGAKKHRIEITDREWAAIQAGAISQNPLLQILSNADLDKVKQLAMPRTSKTLSASKQAKVKLMLSSGYTQAEIANALGVSTTMINKFIK